MVINCTSALITLASADIDKLIGFYTSFLKQEPQVYIPKVYAEFQLPGLRLGIFKPKESNRQEFKPSKSGMSLCLEVSDLEAAIAHLTSIGYPPNGEILVASHGREIYAYDPDGNRLILHQSVSVNSTTLLTNS